jgi:hypothetical protein
MQQQAAQTERAGTRAAEQIQNIIERPVAAYQKSAREAREERRQQLAEERMQGLSDLQKKQLEQQIASEEEFGRPEREAKLTAYKTQAAQAETQRQLADLQMAQAQKEAELMSKVAPSGRTYAEERIMAPIEAQRQQMELASRQATLAEKQAAVNAETQRLAQQNARLGISETEREMRVRDLTAQIAAETDPAARQSKIDALLQQAKPQEVAAAIGTVRSNEAQAQMFNRMLLNQSPQEQALTQESLKANAQVKVQNEAISRLNSAIEELEKAPAASAEANGAARRVALVLQELGYEDEARNMYSNFEFKPRNLFIPGESSVETRTEAAKKARAKILNLFANNIESQYAHLPNMLETAKDYRQQALGMGAIAQGGNIFQQQPTQGYATIPPVYDPLRAAQASGQPQFIRAPDGTLKLQEAPQQTMGGAPQPMQQPGPQAGLPPQLQQFLLQGKPLTQQAGR